MAEGAREHEFSLAIEDGRLLTIVWPKGADLSPRTLYARSRPSVPVGRAG